MGTEKITIDSLQQFLGSLPGNATGTELWEKMEEHFFSEQQTTAPAAVNDTIHLGLCMAGAVSAGAYTAGVMDYLIETLERWEQARKNENAAIPTHKVVIDVMAGTSAGGMTAAIAAAAMQCSFHPVNYDNFKDEKITKQNKLFNSWVNLTGEANMLDGLLEDSDINSGDGKRASSLLNSKFIDQIATDVLTKSVCEIKRPYLSEELDIWLALSNMNGIRHNLDFHSLPTASGKPSAETTEVKKGDGAYISYNYRDFVHFRVTDKATPAFVQQVSFDKDKRTGIELLRDAAMATGAFPIGLAARAFNRPRNLILRNPLYKLLYGFYVGEDLIREDNTYLIIDGGMMNNEPFEVTRLLLHLALTTADDQARLQQIISEQADKQRGLLAARLKEIANNNVAGYTKKQLHDVIKESESLRVKTWEHSNHNKFTRTVILIDPFPSHSPELNEDESKDVSRTQISEVMKGLLKAATGQLLFKVDDIEEAFDADNYSRFLMVPKRRVPTAKGEINAMGSSAIACGAMGGFSGFMNKEYRIHDYLLGRRNCQRFLQHSFMVPADTTNPIFVNGYKNCREKFIKEINGKLYLPLIPDIDPVTLAKNEKVEHTIYWPNQQNIANGFDIRSYLLSHQQKVGSRLSLVMKDIIFKQLKLNWFVRQYLALPFRWPVKNIIAKKIVAAMVEKMEKHHLL